MRACRSSLLPWHLWCHDNHSVVGGEGGRGSFTIFSRSVNIWAYAGGGGERERGGGGVD